MPAGATLSLIVNETVVNAGVAGYTLSFNAVPEPSTYAMMVGAVLLFLGVQRARRTA